MENDETQRAAPRRRAAHADLRPGDPAPWFRQRSSSSETYAFDTAAGRWLLLGFLGSSGDAAGQAALAWLRAREDLFDDDRLAFFGVTADPADEHRLKPRLPGVRWIWDADRRVSRLYGAAPRQPPREDATEPLRRFWMVVDPGLRVFAVIPFTADGAHLRRLEHQLEALPPLDAVERPAPVLHLPRVFEPGLCERLVQAYEARGGEESGFMIQRGGRTLLASDPAHKRRRDALLDDRALIAAARQRILHRIVPEIARASHFHATRMERYLVACYSAEEQGHFRAHRDNTTPGTAHRRFAVSINLNAGFDGGEIGFPEYGARTWRPGPGDAVVFSCSLLHRVTPVTRGRRYAFLPFLYDEAAAAIRDANRASIES